MVVAFVLGGLVRSGRMPAACTSSYVACSPMPPMYIRTPRQSGSTASPAVSAALVSTTPPGRSHRAIDAAAARRGRREVAEGVEGGHRVDGAGPQGEVGHVRPDEGRRRCGLPGQPQLHPGQVDADDPAPPCQHPGRLLAGTVNRG